MEEEGNGAASQLTGERGPTHSACDSIHQIPLRCIDPAIDVA